MIAPFREHRIPGGAIAGELQQFLSTCSSAFLLHDGRLGEDFLPRLAEVSPVPTTIVDVREATPGALEAVRADAGILYACLQDDLGLPFVAYAYARRLRVHPVRYGEPRDYLSRNTQARTSLAQEIEFQRAQGYLKLDFGYGDFANLIQAFEATRGRPGCIVEVGCYRGSSAGALLSYVRALKGEQASQALSFHYLDVFSGFDYPEAIASSDVFWAGTHATDGLEAVRRRILAYGEGLPGVNIEVARCNIISDPIPEAIVRAGVRLANIDVDLYEATAAGLARIAPLMVPGGIMICEDAGHTPMLIGALKAVEEFLDSDAGRRFCRIDMSSGQAFLVATGS